jgi:hypothetical protein
VPGVEPPHPAWRAAVIVRQLGDDARRVGGSDVLAFFDESVADLRLDSQPSPVVWSDESSWVVSSAPQFRVG